MFRVPTYSMANGRSGSVGRMDESGKEANRTAPIIVMALRAKNTSYPAHLFLFCLMHGLWPMITFGHNAMSVLQQKRSTGRQPSHTIT
jgi:hypothetical protein